jgi:hypothetical protein
MKVSSELMSQTMHKYAIAWMLESTDKLKWQEKYNRHDFIIEAWANGIWVKQVGIISYHDLAEYIKFESQFKAYQLPVEKVGKKSFLVGSYQGGKNKYFVFVKDKKWVCNCMRYRCFNNRIEKELPQLYKILNGKIFCHHIVAAYDHEQFLRTGKYY